MRTLLEVREVIKKIYGRYEVYIMPALKFLLALICLLMINGQLGFMSRITRVEIVLIVALMCSFLPYGFMLVFGALFILLHFYALAMEVALVGLCVFLVMTLLFFRFSPRDSLVVLLTPVCFFLKIPYVVPVSMGLIGTPASAVSVGCGVIVYNLVSYVSANATAISALDAAEVTARLRMVIDALLDNRAMFVTLAAFAITVIVVYIIRRLSVDYSWTIAIIAGAMLDAVILLVGDLMYDTNVSVIGVIFGSLVAIALTKALQFFVFNVDYSRTEKVQFEDDEYYYYVKAVPKMTVTEPVRTVKRINTQMKGTPQGHAQSHTGHDSGERAAAGRNYGRTEKPGVGSACGRSGSEAGGVRRDRMSERRNTVRHEGSLSDQEEFFENE